MRKQRRGGKGLFAGAGLLGLVVLSLGTPDACGATSKSVIGPEGGYVRSADGRFSLEVPEDALETDVEIEIVAIECEMADCYEIKPRGVAFLFPAMASYEAGELESMEGAELKVMGADGWQPLADAKVDEDEQLITASVLFLSAFAVQAQ